MLALMLASRVESSVANWSLSRGSTKAATGKGGSLIHPSFQLPFGEAAQTPPWSACSAQVIPDCPSGVAQVSAFSGSSTDGSIFRSEEHTSELQSLMRISYAVFCLKKKKKTI